jgi:small subunit ribosomal protein S20
VPNIRSVKKRMRQSTKRRSRNRVQRAALRSAVKRVRSAATAESAAQAYRDAERLLDRAAQKGLVSKNKAARTKSRLVHMQHRMG